MGECQHGRRHSQECRWCQKEIENQPVHRVIDLQNQINSALVSIVCGIQDYEQNRAGAFANLSDRLVAALQDAKSKLEGKRSVSTDPPQKDEPGIPLRDLAELLVSNPHSTPSAAVISRLADGYLRAEKHCQQLDEHQHTVVLEADALREEVKRLKEEIDESKTQESFAELEASEVKEGAEEEICPVCREPYVYFGGKELSPGLRTARWKICICKASPITND